MGLKVLTILLDYGGISLKVKLKGCHSTVILFGGQK